MILIIDDNDFRREKICKKLYMDSIPAIGCRRDGEKGYNKPIITIIVDPKTSEYNRIYNNSDSNYYLCSKKPIPNLPDNKIIVNKEGFVSPNAVREILYRDFQITLKDDNIGHVTLSAATHDLYVGGEYMHLSAKQFYLISFLVYNYGRQFYIDEIFDYLHFKRISQNSFRMYVSTINGKGKDVNRGKIIEKYEDYYSLSENITRDIRKIKLLQSKEK